MLHLILFLLVFEHGYGILIMLEELVMPPLCLFYVSILLSYGMLVTKQEK